MMSYRKWVRIVSIVNCISLILLLMSLVLAHSYSIQSINIDNTVEHNPITGTQHVSAHDFSPRLDNNNAWRPVGRGDPLKNDPTYDYSPPTLDRVRYWAETNNSTSEQEKDSHKSFEQESLQTYAVAERLASMGLTRKNALANIHKNVKGEVPLLQPKYLAMRRSYYAPQLSTHLMPPPMQTDTTLPYVKSSSPMSWVHNMRTQQPVYDNQFQESVNYMHFATPQQYFSDNSITPVSSTLKQTTAPRKPWLHKILQKEIVKVPNPTKSEAHIPKNIGISTTQRPLSVTSSILNGTPQLPSTTTPAPKTTRLIIPAESNMMSRPTVAPQRLTTDSLFKNYNQADLPLNGPMYLIIEGHSKVKTYGKDELDPHKPKIVPIVPKREPVVRVADPNERRGTIETYQVRHLHTTTPIPTTKTTPVAETSTATTTTTTTTIATVSTSTNSEAMTEVPPTAAQGLLNFLDSFFSTEDTTLQPTTKLKMAESTTDELQRGVRQIFDYDQLPESRVKSQDLSEETTDKNEQQKKENNIKEEEWEEEEEWNEEAEEEGEVEEEEVEEEEEPSDDIIKRIDNLLNSVENEEAQEELAEIFSLEDESTSIPSPSI